MQRLTNPTIRVRMAGLVLVIVAGLVALSAFSALRGRTETMQQRKDATRQVVQVATAVVASFGDQEARGVMTRPQAQAAAVAAVKQLRYSGTEYFWINDMTPTMVMHPVKPELDGKDLAGTTDPDGLHLFQEMVRVVREQGAGFVEYQWPRPGADTPQPKVSYVQGYARWGWVIGSGVYVDSVDAQAWATARAVGLVGLVVLALLVAMTVVVGRSIVSPIRRATAALAGGDVAARVPTGSGRTEMDHLGSAINATLQRAGDVAAQVTAAAEGLDTAAGHLLAAGEHIAAGTADASRQSDAVVDSAHLVGAGIGAVETGTLRLADSITEIAMNAAEAASFATEAVEAAQATSATVQALGERSAEIGTVIKVISQIAGQTNLLALNATIESARAGEAGRGFAVVAGEVKDLARETAEATGTISTQVEEIQRAVAAAADEIARICGVIDKVNEYQSLISRSVAAQSSTTEEMSSTVADAVRTTRGIDEALAGVRDLGERSADDLERIRAATSDLTQTSQRLHRAVAVFGAQPR